VCRPHFPKEDEGLSPCAHQWIRLPIDHLAVLIRRIDQNAQWLQNSTLEFSGLVIAHESLYLAIIDGHTLHLRNSIEYRAKVI